MRSFYFLFCSLFAGQPLVSLAQAADASPNYRFYGGVAAYSSSFQKLGGTDGHTTVPFQATVGYQWQPRWAVQLGVAYSGYNNPYFTTGTHDGSSGGSRGYDFSFDGSTYWRSVSAALLGRYTLTRDLTHRLQVDALGGFIFEHSSLRDTGSWTAYTSWDSFGSAYNSRVITNNLLAGLGPSLRFRAIDHLEVVLDVVLNAPLASDTQHGIKSATALGLRYRFGRG
jgi:hypothetical protein